MSRGHLGFAVAPRETAERPKTRLLRWLRSGMGPVAQPVFKTGAAWQPHARSVRLRRRSVEPSAARTSGIAAPGLARRFPRRRSVDRERRRDGDVVRGGVVVVQLDDVRTRLHLRWSGRADITLRL